MRCNQYLLRLYPRTWRQRYEEEMLAMLELCPSSFLDRVDLVFGALDAHLHPHLGTLGLSLSERMKLMLSLLRRSLLTMFCASLGFLLAGLGFQKMNEYDDFLKAAQTYSLVGLSYHLVGSAPWCFSWRCSAAVCPSPALSSSPRSRTSATARWCCWLSPCWRSRCLSGQPCSWRRSFRQAIIYRSDGVCFSNEGSFSAC